MFDAMPRFIGSRLREAREARALTQVRLADMLGLTSASVCQYEKGTQTPSPETAAKISVVLNLPPQFFTSEPPGQVVPSLLWRARSAANKAMRESHERRYIWFRRIIDLVSGLIELPSPDFPDFSPPEDPSGLSESDVESLAERTRQHWGLGRGPISNVCWLAEQHGALVVRGEMGDLMRDAYSDWDAKTQRCFVFLSADKGSAARSRFDISHELGHAILHRNVPDTYRRTSSIHKLMEDQANRFAGAFMLPVESFTAEMSVPSIQALLHLKPRWRMSIGAMVSRLHHLGVISDDKRRHLIIQMSRKGWNRHEPLDDDLLPEEPQLVRACVDLLLDQRVLTADDLSRRCCLWPTEIEKLLGLPNGYLVEPVPAFKLRLAD